MNEKRIWESTEEELLSELNCTKEGLSQTEAKKRLVKYGYNELQEGKKKSPLAIFLSQFADFLVIILIIAAIVSAFAGDMESTAVILVVITLNAILGTVQTLKAESSLESLKQMSAPTAKVIREGKAMQIPGREVAVGDIVLLEAGDSVCADGRLLESASLKCAEAALTGESLPVEKDIAPISGEAALGDRKNMVFSGSFVTYGRAKFLVTGTGMNTEMGKIATLLKTTEEHKTPLQISLDEFGKKLSIIILVLCGILFGVSIFLRKEPVLDAFLFAIALAVAAIPEALSAIVTIVQSFGTQKMAKENAIIRKLQAVEGLGSVSVICSDKTGTLTQNKMTVKKIYSGGKIIPAGEIDVNDPEQEFLLRSALLCSDATVNENGEVGDPTETALVRLGIDNGMTEIETRTQYVRLGEIPFDSDRKLMSTLHEFNGELALITKGAVDVLLGRMHITEEEKTAVEEANHAFSEQGLRVLAFAKRSKKTTELVLEDEYHLEFVGLIAMMDPPREESKAAVAECIAAGIRPIMITGDHKITASAIAKEIGILTEGIEAVEGAAIEEMTDEELCKFVPKVSVYARVSPEHKIRIVRAWQQRGNLVAMTGDGVNDAPALKQADIGVAMGITGTEVSKDAASMVLADDNFATIVKAVKNGRNIYANIKRAIQFLLSGNAAAIITVIYASLAFMPVPFAAVHLLFINLLTDSLPAIALGMEPHKDELMQEKPRPRSEGILTKKFLTDIAVEGFVIALATIAAFHIGNAAGGAELASTMAFATLCLSRLFHGFNCKDEKPVLFKKQLWNNSWLLAAFAVGAFFLGSVLVVPFLKPLFSVAHLTLPLMAAIIGLAFGSMVVIQALKFVRTFEKSRK